MTKSKTIPVEYFLLEAEKEAKAGNAVAVGDLLREGVERHPQSLDLISHYAFYCYKTGDLTQAAELFARRNTLVEPDADTCNLLAELYQRLHDGEQARYWLKQAMEQSQASFQTQMKYKWISCISKFKQGYQTWQNLAIAQTLRSTAHSLIANFVIAVIWLIEYSTPSLFTLRVETFKSSFSHFLRFVQRYDPYFLYYTLAYHKCREIILTTQCLPADSTAKVLDIGTGHNPLVLYWASLGYAVTALDGSLYGYYQLSNVQRDVERDGHSLQFSYLGGDACNMPIADNSYDYITAICAIEHIPDDGDIVCMKEIYRVLKPGGKAIVTIESNGVYSEHWMIVPYERGYQSGKESTDQPDKKWQDVFCRNYTVHEMKERLGNSANWNTIDIGFYDDFNLPIRSWMDPIQHTILPKLLQPIVTLLSVLFYRKRRFTPQLSTSSIGYIILQKTKN